MILSKTKNGITITAEISDDLANQCGLCLLDMDAGPDKNGMSLRPLTFGDVKNAEPRFKQELIKMIDAELEGINIK